MTILTPPFCFLTTTVCLCTYDNEVFCTQRNQIHFAYANDHVAILLEIYIDFDKNISTTHLIFGMNIS